MRRVAVLILATTIGLPLQAFADDVPPATLSALPKLAVVELRLNQGQVVNGTVAGSDENVLSLSSASVTGQGDVPVGRELRVDVRYEAIAHVSVMRMPKQKFRKPGGASSFWRVLAVTAPDRRASIWTNEHGAMRGLLRDVSEESFVLCRDMKCDQRQQIRMADLNQAEVGVMGRRGRAITWAIVAGAAAIWLGYAWAYAASA